MICTSEGPTNSVAIVARACSVHSGEIKSGSPVKCALRVLPRLSAKVESKEEFKEESKVEFTVAPCSCMQSRWNSSTLLALSVEGCKASCPGYNLEE